MTTKTTETQNHSIRPVCQIRGIQSGSKLTEIGIELKLSSEQRSDDGTDYHQKQGSQDFCTCK